MIWSAVGITQATADGAWEGFFFITIKQTPPDMPLPLSLKTVPDFSSNSSRNRHFQKNHKKAIVSNWSFGTQITNLIHFLWRVAERFHKTQSMKLPKLPRLGVGQIEPNNQLRHSGLGPRQRPPRWRHLYFSIKSASILAEVQSPGGRPFCVLRGGGDARLATRETSASPPALQATSLGPRLALPVVAPGCGLS